MSMCKTTLADNAGTNIFSTELDELVILLSRPARYQCAIIANAVSVVFSKIRLE